MCGSRRTTRSGWKSLTSAPGAAAWRCPWVWLSGSSPCRRAWPGTPRLTMTGPPSSGGSSYRAFSHPTRRTQPAARSGAAPTAVLPASYFGPHADSGCLRSIVASRLSSACRSTGRRVRCPPSSAGQRSWTSPQARCQAQGPAANAALTDPGQPRAEVSRMRTS
jgi:hypothetical protein